MRGKMHASVRREHCAAPKAMIWSLPKSFFVGTADSDPVGLQRCSHDPEERNLCLFRVLGCCPGRSGCAGCAQLPSTLCNIMELQLALLFPWFKPITPFYDQVTWALTKRSVIESGRLRKKQRFIPCSPLCWLQLFLISLKSPHPAALPLVRRVIPEPALLPLAFDLSCRSRLWTGLGMACWACRFHWAGAVWGALLVRTTVWWSHALSSSSELSSDAFMKPTLMEKGPITRWRAQGLPVLTSGMWAACGIRQLISFSTPILKYFFGLYVLQLSISYSLVLHQYAVFLATLPLCFQRDLFIPADNFFDDGFVTTVGSCIPRLTAPFGRFVHCRKYT